MKYISEECRECDEYIEPYGCTDHGCEIYQEYQAGREEMAADEEHDRRKENKLDPIFDGIMNTIRGM